MSKLFAVLLLTFAVAASARTLANEENAAESNARSLLSCRIGIVNPFIKAGACRSCNTLTNNYFPNASIRAAKCFPCGKLGLAACTVGETCAPTISNPYVRVNGTCGSCGTTTNNYVATASITTATCTACGLLGQAPCTISGCDMGIPDPFVLSGVCTSCNLNVNNYGSGTNVASATCTLCGGLNQPPCTRSTACRDSNPWLSNGKCASCDTNRNNYGGNANPASASCSNCGASNEPPCTASYACKGFSNPWVSNGVCVDCDTNSNRYSGNSGPTSATCTGCWTDGTTCGLGTTCNNCCRAATYWYGPAFTRCGNEPCYPADTVCLLGTSCNRCCSGSTKYKFPGAACA